jgi:hypothetical protein
LITGGAVVALVLVIALPIACVNRYPGFFHAKDLSKKMKKYSNLPEPN